MSQNTNSLKAECHQLIEQISHRPGATKLLLGAKAALSLYARYKLNRRIDFSRSKPSLVDKNK
jgi:hypothetical protein